mmetsp:Transcript_4041/g.5015  ORF Transcript_4041/g.5015 Transcript_4041/m.5015 type:complete len:370 (-) Transcript_4041:958-2067(-)
MDTEKLQLLAEEMSCSLCLELFREPRVLPCQHSFCTECLLQITDGPTTELECPLCRKVYSLGDNGVMEFPINLSLVNILSHLQRDDIRRIISPDVFPTRHALLQSFPPAGPGTDFSFLAFRRSFPRYIPRDLNERYSIAPVLIDRERALSLFKNWFQNLWFLPSKLRDIIESHTTSLLILKLIPFYKLSYKVNATYTAEITPKSVFNTKFTHAGRAKNIFGREEFADSRIICADASKDVCTLLNSIDTFGDTDDITITCATTILDDALPWFACWRKGNGDAILLKQSQREIGNVLRSECLSWSIYQLDTRISEVSHNLSYFPFYFTSYQYDDRIYNVTICARTGEIYGERPYGLGKLNFGSVKNWFSLR